MGGKIWFYAGSSILALLVASALLAPFIAPHDPAQQNLDQDLLTYSSDHLFGTDKLGRDVLSRTLYGGRVSLLVGVITVAISLSLGFAIGSLSGYLGGWVDQLLMRLVDVLLGFAGILLGIALYPVLDPALDCVLLALSLFCWHSSHR